MAAAVLLDVGRQLEAAMSSGRSLRFEQLLDVDVCSHLDRLAKFCIQTGARGSVVAPEVIHDTQLVFNLGKLLGLVLEQHVHGHRVTSWENLAYCALVQKTAAAMVAVFTMADRHVLDTSSREDPVFARQLAASRVLPGLVAALLDLAEAVEAATEPCQGEQCSCILPLRGVLALVLGIFGVWPGASGVLKSGAAGPVVQPTLRLLVALFQHAVAINSADAFEVAVINSTAGMSFLADLLLRQIDRALDDKQQQAQSQDHSYLKDLQTSPAFLTLLLTVSCMILHSASAATPAALAARMNAATAAVVADRAAPAVPELQMQVTEILQDLYGQSNTTSRWHLLLSGCEVVTNTGWHDIATSRNVLLAAAACLQQVNAELQQHAAAAAAAVEMHSSSERHQTPLSLPQQQRLALRALRQLPVVLLGVLCSASVQSVCRVHSAAVSLVRQVIAGWRWQLMLQSSSAGVRVEQLPRAELLRVLLQQLKVLQQMKLEAAAALVTAQLSAVGAGSSLESSPAAADHQHAAASAVEVESNRVETLDIALGELLEVLSLLQTVSQYAVWQPHVHEVAAAVEHCLRSISINTYDAATTLLLHQNLCIACDYFLRHGAKSMNVESGDSERPVVAKEPGVLLRAAAAAAPGSQEQQQLFTLLITLLKRNSHLQLSEHAAHGLEEPRATVARIGIQVVQHMLDTLCSNCSSSSSSPSANAALTHGLSGGKLLYAAVPWLVAASRLVLHTATQLAKSLEALKDQLRATSADGPCSSSSGDVSGDVVAQTGPVSDAAKKIVGEHLRHVLHCNEWLLCSAVRWVNALDRCCRLLATSSTGGCSSTGSNRDVTAVCDDSASVVGVSTAAAGPAAVLDVVQELQQVALQEARRALQSETVRNELTMLQRVWSAASSDWQQETEAEEQLCWGFSAAAAVTPQADLEVELSKHVLESYDVKQLLQEWCNVGHRVCAVFPLKYCCNNPPCNNVSSHSEWALVSDKVCTGCKTARYCSQECQAAHWPWHKPICRAIKKQSRAKQQDCKAQCPAAQKSR